MNRFARRLFQKIGNKENEESKSKMNNTGLLLNELRIIIRMDLLMSPKKMGHSFKKKIYLIKTTMKAIIMNHQKLFLVWFFFSFILHFF